MFETREFVQLVDSSAKNAELMKKDEDGRKDLQLFSRTTFSGWILTLTRMRRKRSAAATARRPKKAW